MSAAYGGEGAAAAAAAIANAVKATGAIVRVTPEEFNRILARIEQPVIVTGRAGLCGDNSST